MSMHTKPLTQLEEDGLRAHGLAIGTPSQLSDAFRQGVAWALVNAERPGAGADAGAGACAARGEPPPGFA